MSEIVYFWLGGKKAVAVSKDVQLPQFHVLGYRQGYRVIELTTGNIFIHFYFLKRFERSLKTK